MRCLFLLGVLNSKLLRFYYRQNSLETRRVFPQVHISALIDIEERAKQPVVQAAQTLASSGLKCEQCQSCYSVR